MEVMYVNNVSDSYFSNKGFIGYYGIINDMCLLLDTIQNINIRKSKKVKKLITYNEEYFNILNLTKDILDKKVEELSYSEYKLVLLIKTIESKPEIIILNNFDLGFVYKGKSRISKLIKYVHAEMNINFIIITNDVLFMNKNVKHIMIIKNKIIKYQGDIIGAIKQGLIDKPPILEFIDLANEEGAKLDYTLDNKELLKGIYRSVF